MPDMPEILPSDLSPLGNLTAAAKRKRMDYTHMTTKLEVFCDSYLMGLSAAQAAKKAGYSTKSAASTACKLLRQDKIQQYLTKKRAELEAKKIITREECLTELKTIIKGTAKDADKIAAVRTVSQIMGYVNEGLDGLHNQRLTIRFEKIDPATPSQPVVKLLPVEGAKNGDS